MANKTETVTFESQRPVVAAFETPGVLGSLYFTEDANSKIPLPSDHIQVNIITTGLDFDDLEIWSGRVDTFHDLMEYSGVTTELETSVCNLAVGDHVYGLVGGKLRVGNFARVPAILAMKLQPNDDAFSWRPFLGHACQSSMPSIILSLYQRRRGRTRRCSLKPLPVMLVLPPSISQWRKGPMFSPWSIHQSRLRP